MTDTAPRSPQAPVQPAAPPTGSATGSRQRVPDKLITAVLAVMLLGLAEVAAMNEWVSRLILPRPSAVAIALWSGLESGVYWRHIGSTVGATVGGFLIAAITAVAIAGVLASVARLERVFMPFIIAFQTVPKIAIAPLIILWLGFDELGKTIIVTIVCFFPILVNALQGLRMRDRAQLELFRSLGASHWQLFRYVRVPNSLPYLFAGFHIAILFALIGAIVAEFVGSRAGLGWLLMQSRAQFNVAGVFAILILLMIIGSTLHKIMQVLERRIAFWSTDVTVVSS